ncbi:MAG: hypothetical protein LBJ00_07155, partial [Planctomycetaceae bacterium]|nr:hypothetical protein [Planctomycetaceae bacterium]
MKKANLVSSLVNAEVNVNVDVTTNVNLGDKGKQGGGGGGYLNSETKIPNLRIFVTIIVWGFT